MDIATPEASTVEVRRRPVGERSDLLDPRVDITHEERWRSLRAKLRQLAFQAQGQGAATLAERITKLVEDTDSLVMEIIEDEALDE